MPSQHLTAAGTRLTAIEQFFEKLGKQLKYTFDISSSQLQIIHLANNQAWEM
jgi:hypothetical protein